MMRDGLNFKCAIIFGSVVCPKMLRSKCCVSYLKKTKPSLAERVSLFLRRTVMEISSRGGFSGFLVDFV